MFSSHILAAVVYFSKLRRINYHSDLIKIIRSPLLHLLSPKVAYIFSVEKLWQTLQHKKCPVNGPPWVQLLDLKRGVLRDLAPHRSS